MAEEAAHRYQRPGFWIWIVAIIIVLIFLYFYQPFETYLVERIPHIHFSNVIFWFASLVGVVGYLVSHWQSFRQNIFKARADLDVVALVFETLLIAILVAVIFCAGAIIQAIVQLSEYLISGGAIIDGAFGQQLLAIFILVLLAIVFFLLHYVVRAFRSGWHTRRPPRQAVSS